MDRRAVWMTGIGAGAAAAYWLDPARGTRRRAMTRDALVRAGHRAVDATATTARDLRNRSRGIGAAAARMVRRDAADDLVVQERVRAAMGRAVSHPHAIDVDVQNGAVVLTGPILSAEVPALLSAVAAVRGVNRVENRLELHEQAGTIPSLQGGPPRQPRPSRIDVRQRHWAPATRCLVGGTGIGLIAMGTRRGDAAGMALALTGATLFARAATNLEMGRLFGVGSGRRAIDVQKTITVNAPLEEVFDFWDNFENFPGFMRHVRDVRPTRDPRQWHWVVSAAAGVPVEFDAVVTERIPNEVIAWKSAEGSAVAHAGLVRFSPIRFGSTRVHIRMSYNPPGGAMAHGLLALMGADLKTLLEEDLVRMKTAIETGRSAHDAARPEARPPADEFPRDSSLM